MTFSTSLTSLVNAAEGEFARRLGRRPRWVVTAPGRVNLIGEHTDYNDGFVLPMAIDRHVVIAADVDAVETAPGRARLFSTALEQWANVGLQEPWPRDLPGWAQYVQGVIAGFPDGGANLQPFAAIVHADLPVGGGLSSSAALEVAAASLLEAMTGTRLEPLQKALLCQKAEHDYARVPCGIMDQCSVIMGRAGSLLLLDCRSREAELVPLSDPDVLALIVNSNVKHALTDGGYAVRRKQCETAARFLGVAALRDVTMAQLEKSRTKLDEVLYRRARHVIGENERTLGTAQALKRGDWDTVGAHMAASHESLRRDYEVSCAELDVLVELAAQIGPAGGVVGARMTGGGFGGCTISLVRRWALEEVMTRIGAGYQQRTGRQASMFVTTPAAGARIIY